MRVALSNAFGTAPLTVGAAHIALRDKDSAIVSSSARTLTFSGRKTMAIPSGAMLISDPVDLAVPAMGDLAIDLYLPGDTNTPSPLTTFTSALQTSYISETGNHAGASSFPVVAKTPSWFVVSRIEVMAPQSVGAVVAVGDSITAGSRSTADTNNRYPNHLAARLAAAAAPLAVLNAGIGGNRVLTEGAFTAGVNVVGRFERDVLAQPGITHAIVLEGINDIGNARDNPTPTAEDLIAAHKQLIDRAHTRGIVIFGATLTPYEGAMYFTAVGEAKRQALNQWIRTSRAYDGVDRLRPGDSRPEPSGAVPAGVRLRRPSASRRRRLQGDGRRDRSRVVQEVAPPSRGRARGRRADRERVAHRSPSSTTVPSPRVTRVRSLVIGLSARTSMTSAKPVIVSPGRTGALKLQLT